MMENRYKPITVLVKYENEHGAQQEKHSGFLTGDMHAMYLESSYNRLMFAQVLPSDEPGVYLDHPSNFISLGILDDAQAEQVIWSLADLFHTMTGYQFLTKVITQVNVDLDLFNDLPNLLKPYNKLQSSEDFES